MRAIHTLGFTCVAVFSWAGADQHTAQPAPHQMTARAAATPPALSSWRPAATRPPHDRLRYLEGSLCAERLGCTTSAYASRSRAAPAEYDYIESLSLGDYGPMKFKFTGDRVKMKLRF